MGQNETKGVAPPPKPDLLDVIMEMKMTSKQFERESKKAEGEKKKMLERAKQALIKGNEEGAK